MSLVERDSEPDWDSLYEEDRDNRRFEK